MRRKLIYLLISAVIVLQFGFRGYFFLLDNVPVLSSKEIMKTFYGFNPPVYGGMLPLQLLATVIPAEIFQRLMMFSILFFSGISMDSLASRFVRSDLAKLYASIFYMLNPFTYIRLLVGHWVILLSYSLLPFGVYCLLDLLEKNDLGSAFKFAIVQTLIGLNSHVLFISVLIYAIFLATMLRFPKHLITAILLFFLLSAYWLIPLATFRGQTLLSHISEADLKTFAPKGTLFDLMAMYGFWKYGYVYAKDFLYPEWMFVFLVFFGLFLLGFVGWERRKLALAFILVWLLGFVLASGIKGPLASVLKPLFEKTILKGMRDSQKFVTMLVLSYSVLGSVGLENLLGRCRREYIALLIIVLIFVNSFTFFNHFAGQIKPADFPKDWYTVRAFLDKDNDDFRVLFFPWHLYMSFHWLPTPNKLIANPAPLFFDKDVISAKNIEIPGVYTEIYTPYQVYIMNLLKNKTKVRDFGKLVSVIGVKYILLTKEVDYRNYYFLFNQSDLKLVMDTKNFYVFKNEEFKGLVLSGIFPPTWRDIKYYTSARFSVLSPAKVDIMASQGYILFMWPYSKYWSLEGKKPRKAFDVVCWFRLKGRGSVVYERFYNVCLPSYIVSVLTGGSVVAYACVARYIRMCNRTSRLRLRR